jgi:chemotaxis protein CheZ
MNAAETTADNPELEALFDSIVMGEAQGNPQARQSAGDENDADVLTRVGRLTRTLHDTLTELGYASRLREYAAEAIPDTRARLAYVASMTEQAASRALNAVETAQPLQDELGGQAERLAARWDALYRNELSVDEFKALVGQTREFLRATPQKTRTTGEQLREIMMAQDFQDLTGQVIKRITDCAQEMESQLLKLLVDHAPPEKRSEATSLLNGPQINGKTKDVVTSQAQVDELLESLGF